ncbi:hypothetical protein ACFZAT_23585 [Streptomyces sp. NPDC008163]|uniref:hypothetical protein n=1 Tax=Streptomyces sp. NPDC008163 TaxID=3364818 RepID=UPI0036ECDC5E
MSDSTTPSEASGPRSGTTTAASADPPDVAPADHGHTMGDAYDHDDPPDDDGWVPA